MNNKIHTLPELPYAYDALLPYIDEETMRLHHDKHHAAYVNNLNSALEKYPDLLEKSPEELILSLNELPEEIRTTVRNNAGGHINHTMFWEIMSSSTGEMPEGKLLEAIEKQFGSFLDFKTKFKDAGLKRFGSGWIWLVKNKDGGLEIISTPNQDNPMIDGLTPIFGNDLWEHAYYLKYKNMRADYLEAWWNVVNWQEVERRFKV